MMIRKGMFIGDRYEIIDKVGSGGMSDVYKAKDHKLNRFVAIKVLKSEFSEDKNFVSKFKIEAQSAAGLAHPNIVNVYDVGENENLHYIVMELIEGITLKKYIEKKGKLAVREAVSIAIQVAQGIEAAHNNHIIHRDIKPQNIIISREGKVKVTDFGIARAASANTINSNAMGSVHYISPEQARGGYIDEKSDIYSLGISLFEMLTGKVPFEGDSTVQIALAHIQEKMPDPREYVKDLPISVVRIIEKCTQKKADRRYLKVSSLIADLKKSLVTPDEDFVVIAPAVNNDSTIMITGDEISVIRKEAEAAAGNTPESEENDDSLDETDDDEDDVFGDEQEDDSNPKLDKIVAISAIVAAIIVLIIGILIVTTVVKGCGGDEPEIPQESTTDGKTTIVPDAIGKTQEEAIQMLKDAYLGYRIVSENNNTIEEGHVIRLSEDVGSVVEKQSTIVITVSLGAEAFDIPPVVGLDKTEAKELLESEQYGLQVEIEWEPSDDIEEDIVMSTNPKAPTQLKYGDKITLTVSLGQDTSDVQVPSLKNLSEAEAKDALQERGLVLVVKERINSSTVSSGKIISQEIAANTTVPRGTEINVTMSIGPAETSSKEPDTTTQEPTTTSAKEYTVIFAAFNISNPPEKETDENGDEIDYVVEAYVSYKDNGTGDNVSAKVTEQLGNNITDTWNQGQISLTRTNCVSGQEATLTVTVNGATVYTNVAVFR